MRSRRTYKCGELSIIISALTFNLRYVVSNLPMIVPGSFSIFNLINIILIYWCLYSLQQIFMLQCYPIAYSKSSWSLHIHQWPRLYIVSRLRKNDVKEFLERYQCHNVCRILWCKFCSLIYFWCLSSCCYICVLCHDYVSKQSETFYLLLQSGQLYLTHNQISMIGPLSDTISVALVDHSMIFTTPLNRGHLHVPCSFSMLPQATHIFLLVAMSEAGDRNIYLARE